jgi:hypothetical protein
MRCWRMSENNNWPANEINPPPSGQAAGFHLQVGAVLASHFMNRQKLADLRGFGIHMVLGVKICEDMTLEKIMDKSNSVPHKVARGKTISGG